MTDTKETKVGFHPKKDYEVFYEVTDNLGETMWGGASEHDAVDWFHRSPAGSRLYVSAWESNDEDSQPIGRTIDITPLIGAVRGYE